VPKLLEEARPAHGQRSDQETASRSQKSHRSADL